MLKRPAATARSAPWFIPDRAISKVGDDHLDHDSVAGILVEAIRGASPPATIGLLGGFGKGKSSTGNLVMARFANDLEFDVVRVSADKHSGEARARNLVHSVAGELVGRGVRQGGVDRLARQLRESTAHAVLDPTDTAAQRLIDGRYDWRKLLPSAVAWISLSLLSLVFLLGAVVVQGGLGYALAALTSLPLLAIVLYAASRGTMRQIGVLLTPGLRTDSVPRAEAADDVELVFSGLVDLHRSERERQLVVIVDDVDRLAPPDLLDALRVIKSLQAVPRGSEPIFVLACDEDIVLAAIESAGPSESPAGAYDPTIASTTDDQGQVTDAVDPPVAMPSPRSAASSSERAPGEMARAFLDKLFTVRITMPPVIEDDMREFAGKVIPPDHPLRTIDGFPLEQVVAALMHDDVDDPRSAIRLLNRFFAAYLLGRTREQAKRLSDGAVTSHPIVLARLCVLADEFPEFYRQVAANPVLLEAADKLSQASTDLSASEQEALDQARLIEAGSGAWRNESLRRYLRSTSRRISYPDDLAALFFFAQSEGGRLLGAERRDQIRSALRSRDGERMVEIVNDTPENLVGAVAGELERSLKRADSVSAGNYLEATIPAIPALGAHAGPVVAAAVDLLVGSPADANPGAQKIATLVDHSEPSVHASLCAEMVRRVNNEPVPDLNRRMATAAVFSGSHPLLRGHIEPAVVGWLGELPSEGGWELGGPWIDAAEALVPGPEPARALVAEYILAALVGLIHGPEGFGEADADRIVALAETARPVDPAPITDQIGALDGTAPPLAAFGTRLLSAINSGGSLGASQLTARAAGADAVPDEVRAQAAGLTAGWAALWAGESTTSEADGEEVVEPVAPAIIADLVSAVDAAPDAAVGVARHLDALTASLEEDLQPLVDALVADALEGVSDPEWRSDAEQVAAALVNAAPALPAPMAGAMIDRLLGPLGEDARSPEEPACASALRLIPILAGTSVGTKGLTRLATALADAITATPRSDRRTQVVAMSTIAQVAPDVVAAAAPPVLSYYESLAGATLTEDQVRALALFPWSDDSLAKALVLIDARRDEIVPEDLVRSFELVPRALGFVSEDQIPSSLLERMVGTLEGDPLSGAAGSVARSWKVLEASQRRRALRAGAGFHADLDARLQALSTKEAGEVILGATDRDSAERLLSVLPDSERQAVSLECLEGAPERPIEGGVFDLLVAGAPEQGLAELVGQGLAALPAANETAARTLRIAQLAGQRGVAVDLERVDELLADLIGEASEEVSGLLGALLAGRQLSARAREALKAVRDQEDTRHVAEAFDVAHSRR